ncbi:hypothetical protein NP590_03090 [Methylomonas sp. SURF-2]|uniref:Hemolytic protein HlpA-like protein n=1 Tax=Methylomonas subterranea TaxID=2952225 RepID=A0ABT1TD96_9GAMM|nr:hypothetical protein [Methylomonas sp. SURF-2]MCQ8103082.1 hypothetical protein [Methylomonas sp. SURF-2]
MNGFNVPVAILNFNRPQMTRRVFEMVKQIKPRKLLLVADGPRPNRPDDVRLCAEVRSIFNEIDWECEVHKKFSDINLGSFKSNSSGLNWIFDTVEEAIIIEDDCVPSVSFFRYCEELLERYRDNPNVGVITGYNLGFPAVKNNESYFFSAYTLNWAWASWRRVWKQVDMDMSWWEPRAGKRMLQALFPKRKEWTYWFKLYEQIRKGDRRNAWDYQLILSAFKHSQYCIIPSVNMVSNIGFGPEGTNCFDDSSPMHNQRMFELQFPLIHPPLVQRSGQVDYAVFKSRFYHYVPFSLHWQILSRISLLIKTISPSLHAGLKVNFGKWRSTVNRKKFNHS